MPPTTRRSHGQQSEKRFSDLPLRSLVNVQHRALEYMRHEHRWKQNSQATRVLALKYCLRLQQL
jgi:hypothetical protein